MQKHQFFGAQPSSQSNSHIHTFHILAIAISAAVNIGMIYLFKLVFVYALDKYPEVGLLDHMLVLSLTF